MNAVVRQLVLLALATVISWWLLLRGPEPTHGPEPRVEPGPPVAVTPRVEPPPPAQVQPATAAVVPTSQIEAGAAAQAPAPGEEGERDPGTPAPELGAPDGKDEAETEAASTDALADADTGKESPAEDSSSGAAIATLMSDAELLASAQSELSGEVRKGFSTVFITAPEDQVSIARFFGEELVLVPRQAMNPETTSPGWFRVGAGPKPKIEQMQGRPPLSRYRQYRDLFDYEYARLPAPLRSLRRSVLLRSEVYLFAALVPPAEWAAVIGRRREALAQADRPASEVRRFVIRYDRLTDATYDVAVQEIVFQDGTRFRPESPSR